MFLLHNASTWDSSTPTAPAYLLPWLCLSPSVEWVRVGEEQSVGLRESNKQRESKKSKVQK